MLGSIFLTQRFICPRFLNHALHYPGRYSFLGACSNRIVLFLEHTKAIPGKSVQGFKTHLYSWTYGPTQIDPLAVSRSKVKQLPASIIKQFCLGYFHGSGDQGQAIVPCVEGVVYFDSKGKRNDFSAWTLKFGKCLPFFCSMFAANIRINQLL